MLGRSSMYRSVDAHVIKKLNPVRIVIHQMSMSNLLKCVCEAAAKDTSKERGRFKRRHPKLCLVPKLIIKDLEYYKSLAGSKEIRDIVESVRAEVGERGGAIFRV
jgi:hypothetical protein